MNLLHVAADQHVREPRRGRQLLDVLLRRLRDAVDRCERFDDLRGFETRVRDVFGGAGQIVEADETYFGNVKGGASKLRTDGVTPRKFPRKGPSDKRAVLGLIERGGKVRTFHVAQATKENVAKLVTENVHHESALMTDLKRLGLFDETLIIWGGEFGRTPTVELPQAGANAGKINGRDHNHYGFTVWLAGGGVKKGSVYGATDEFGFKAVENRVHVHDLHATLLKLMGFDHERFTYRYAGRDFRLTDVHGTVIEELIG